MICCPVTTVRLTAAGVPRIIATERTYRLACRSMVALLVLSQLALSSYTAALKLLSTKSCSSHSFAPLPVNKFPPPRICVLANLCGAGRVNNTKQLTLLIFPGLENSFSESVLFINILNSSFVILKVHTIIVVHIGVPKDYIYLNLLCLSYIGNILSLHSILAQSQSLSILSLSVLYQEGIVAGTLIVCCLEVSAFIIGRGVRYRVKIIMVFISYPRECQDSPLIFL